MLKDPAFIYLATVLPPILIGIIIWKSDRFPEPGKFLTASFLLGASIALPLGFFIFLSEDHLAPLIGIDYKIFNDFFYGKIEWAESCDGYGDADTEYYSACGYDDMIGAQKEGAKGTALECWRALKELKDSLFDKKKYGNSEDELTAEYRQMLIYLRMNFGMFLNIRL